MKGIRRKRIVCIGSAEGWGAEGRKAPPRRRSVEHGVRGGVLRRTQPIDAARRDRELVDRCVLEARAYLDGPGVTLLPLQEELTTAELLAGKGRKTTLDEMRGFVEQGLPPDRGLQGSPGGARNRRRHSGTMHERILPVAETTACLTLTLLNDSGCLAFCESDFVAIPSGILLHCISAEPVFFCNPTFPHRNMVTVGIQRHPQDGRKEPRTGVHPHALRVRLWRGAASRDAPRPGTHRARSQLRQQPVDRISGGILENPALDICTSQLDIGIEGDCTG